MKDVACEIFRKLAQNRQKPCDHFLTNLKFSNPDNAVDGRIRNFFLIDFDIWNVESGVRMRKLDQF